MNDDGRRNVEFGQNGTIGALVLNPGSTNVCDQKGKCELLTGTLVLDWLITSHVT